MTHGDKAKAKADKSNKASVKKAGGQGGENGKSKAGSQDKAVAKIDKAVAQVSKAGLKGKASQASQSHGKAGEGNKAGEGSKGAEKAAAAKKGGSSAKESSGRSTEPKTKGSAAPAETAGGFTNPAIDAAFRQAIKKYPNALRKLTD